MCTLFGMTEQLPLTETFRTYHPCELLPWHDNIPRNTLEGELARYSGRC